MPYTITTPRKFDFQTRLFGLRLKQWAYMSVGIALAGLIGLGVLIPGLPFVLRVILGLIVMAPSAALAYLRFRGLPLDKALVIWIRYQFSPKQRVWRKGFADYAIEEEYVEPEAPVIAVDRQGLFSTAIVLVNLLVIGLLVTASVYMLGDGLEDIHEWFW